MLYEPDGRTHVKPLTCAAKLGYVGAQQFNPQPQIKINVAEVHKKSSKKLLRCQIYQAKAQKWFQGMKWLVSAIKYFIFSVTFLG